MAASQNRCKWTNQTPQRFFSEEIISAQSWRQSWWRASRRRKYDALCVCVCARGLYLRRFSQVIIATQVSWQPRPTTLLTRYLFPLAATVRTIDDYRLQVKLPATGELRGCVPSLLPPPPPQVTTSGYVSKDASAAYPLCRLWPEDRLVLWPDCAPLKKTAIFHQFHGRTGPSQCSLPQQPPGRPVRRAAV